MATRNDAATKRRKSKVARRVFWISSATVMGRAMIPMFWGIAALTFWKSGYGSSLCNARNARKDPTHRHRRFADGRYVFAAFMSTHDSYLLAWSGVIVRDVISPLRPLCLRQTVKSQMTEHGEV